MNIIYKKNELKNFEIKNPITENIQASLKIITSIGRRNNKRGSAKIDLFL